MGSRFSHKLAYLVIALFASVFSGQSTSQEAPTEYVPDEILIQFRPAAEETEKALARQAVGALRKRTLHGARRGELELASVPHGRVAQVIQSLKKNPAVVLAEPNWIYKHQTDSNDPLYTNGSLWGMYGDTTSPSNQYGSQAGEAWSKNSTGSSAVYVGVIDEGIDLNHPDLAANIWTNPFDPPDGVDNDGNGYIDDLHGWDFFQKNNTIYDGAPGDNDTDSHGTHVSGTIGATGGNGRGVAGVNWQVTIISAKFLGPNGGTTAAAVEALNYLTDLKTRHGLNIVATNNSWGGGGYSQALHDAIIRAAKAGILFVAAAGNGNSSGVGQNNDTTARYPTNYDTSVGTSTETAADYDAVISVASLTSSGSKSSFSNYGIKTVDLGAPGSGVYSTTPNNTYRSFSGTSMATPHVTGAAALYWSLNPDATALAVKNAILETAWATPTASLNGITVTGGRLNIGELGPPGPPPAAPTGLVANVASSSRINLSWQDTSGESGYKLERCAGGGCTDFVQIAQVSANSVNYSDTGLSSSTAYRYRVRAFNSGGSSEPSNIAEATTDAPQPPAAPSNLTASAASSSRINLSWKDNSGDEAGFRIERCQGVGCSDFVEIAAPGANVTSYGNTGLSPETSYTYRVLAHNAEGDSPYSDTVSATTQPAPAPPSAPTGLTAVAVSSSRINLNWTDNSGDETGFRIERCRGVGCSAFVQIAVLGANVTSYGNSGLSSNTSYSYRVVALNAVGDSPYSNTASATTQAPPTAPSAPTGLTAVAISSSRINLTWTDTSNSERGFRIERCRAADCTNFAWIATVGANVTSYRNIALFAGTMYRYRVRAYNAEGNSPYSNVAGATTPPRE